MQSFKKLTTTSAITFWDELIKKSSAQPTIAHNPHFFQFFDEFLSLSPFYFFLNENDKTLGLLPLVKVGNQFVSMPHLSYGGILWLPKLKEQNISEEETIIRNVVSKIQLEKPVSGFYSIEIPDILKESIYLSENNIEIRGEQPFFENHVSFKTRHFYFLKNEKEEQLLSFPSNLRRKISKALKNGLSVRTGKEELLNDFIWVYQKNMHQLGSPSFDKYFFRNLLQIPGLKTLIFVAYFQGKPVGGAFCISYFDFMENIWFSTLSKYNKLYPSYLLHWQMIDHAISQGKKIYSFGRSTTGSGVQAFKKQWLCEEKPLYFSKTKLSKMSLKDQKWMTKIWKIMPPFVVNRIGPYVAKRIY